MQDEFWSNTRLEVEVVGPDGSQQQLLDQPYALVGTDRRCDIVLPDTRLPARCYAVLLTGEGLLGVSLVRRSIARFRRVDGERGIRVGRFRVFFRTVTPAVPSNDPVGDSEDFQSDDHLPAYLCWEAANRKRYAPLKIGRPLLFGRRSPSRVCLESRAVSAVHGMVVRDGPRLWVVDLASTNGTLVGGRWVRRAALLPDESFEVGGICIRYARTSRSADVTTGNGSRPGTTDAAEAAELISERDALLADVGRLHVQVEELQRRLSDTQTQLERLEAERLEWAETQDRRLDEIAQWNRRHQDQHAELARRQRELGAAEQQHAACVMHWRHEWARSTEGIAARREALGRSEHQLAAEWAALERARDELAQRTAEWADRLERLTAACHATDRQHAEQASQLQRNAEQLLVRRIRLQRQFERQEQELKQRQNELEHWHRALTQQLEELARQQVELTERELQLKQRAEALSGHSGKQQAVASRNGHPRHARTVPSTPGVPEQEIPTSVVAAGSSADARPDEPIELANPLLESADFTDLLSEFLIEEDEGGSA